MFGQSLDMQPPTLTPAESLVTENKKEKFPFFFF